MKIGIVIAAFVATIAQAETNVVYVDFGPSGDEYSDVTDTYNNFSGTGSKNLSTSTGAASGITLQHAQYGGTYNYASGTARDSIAGISTDLTTDRLYVGTGGTADIGEFGYTLTISGLDSEGTCGIAVIPSPTGIAATWKIVTGTGDGTEYVQDATASNNYFEWPNVLPDESGTVVITGRAVSNSKWKSVGLSGLVISAEPTPVRVAFTSVDGSNTVVHARGMNVDYQYTLECSTNLLSGDWEPVDETVFSVQENQWDREVSSAPMFYRVVGQDKRVDMALISGQFVDYFASSAPADTETQENLNSLLADGSWADIDYTNQDAANWPVRDHLYRLLAMAQSYAASTSDYYEDADLLAAILSGLQYWIDNDFYNPNWYNREIAVPILFLKTFILLDDDLPDAMYADAAAAGVLHNTDMDMTGANQVSLANKAFMRGLLDGDLDLMYEASTVLWNELYVTTDEGIQADWSFHQHGPQQQFGNYGLGQAAMMIDQAMYMCNTFHALADDKLEILRNFFVHGECWVLWNDVMDISAQGRQIGPGKQASKGSSLKARLAQMIEIDPDAAALYEQSLTATNELVGHRSFWRSDMAVHRRPDWYCSVKMCSTRVVGTETANDENLLGIHLADGAHYIYQTGNEYDDVMGLWDWHRLPGTTCDQGNDSLTPKGYNKDYGGSAFVGVLDDGTNGLASMIYKRNSLAAQKAWFFEGDSVVCLGAGIGGSTSGSVYTSIEQSVLTGSVVSDTGTLTQGTHVLPADSWVQHNGIGYHMLKDSTLHFDSVTGNWVDINAGYEDATISGDVFSIWMDHGPSPVDQQYAYIIYPQTAAEEMDERIAADTTTILTNSAILQAIEGDAGVSAVFYEAGQLTTTSGTVIETDSPCLLNLNGTRLIVSEPTQTLVSLILTVNGRPYYVALPVDGLAGSQVELQVVDTPYISTEAATEVGADQATLHANLGYVGEGDCAAKIYWGIVDGGTDSWANEVDLGSVSVGEFSTVVSGLESGREYWFRAWASNDAGGFWATESMSFRTMGAPVVAPAAVSDVTASSAVLGGTLSGGIADVTVVWDTADQGLILSEWSHCAVITDQALGTFSSSVTELLPETTYCFRSYASNELGQAWSEVLSFTTPAASDVDYVLIEDFDSLTVDAAIAGQGDWGGDTTSTSEFIVSVDPDDAANQVFLFNQGSNKEVYLNTADLRITDGTTSTLFFRMRAAGDDAGTLWFRPATFSKDTAPSDFSDGETDLSLSEDESGNVLLADQTLPEAAWMKVWMVVDAANDTFSVVMETASGTKTTVVIDQAFRNGSSSNDLVSLMFKVNSGTGSGSQGDVWFDDFYIVHGEDARYIAP